jgi:hypothetical protein
MGNGIGGYFELELPLPQPFLYPQALRFQSARAAFLALLRSGEPKRIWMPKYICDAMLAPLVKQGIECVFYSINEQFDIAGEIDFRAGDWLFYVNYFGICTENVDRILTRYDPDRVILDHAQAFYAQPRECLATIYSPRKFFGIPDGGLLITDLPIKIPSEIDEGSVGRVMHLFKRLAGSPESGYADYKQAEQSLGECEPRQMSRLTKRLLAGVDVQWARMRRNENFSFLHGLLGGLNRISVPLEKIDGPLCYPFFTNSPGIKEALIAERVFVPTYWPDVKNRVSAGDVECNLVDNGIAIPCDQRYATSELELASKIIHQWEKSK